MVLYGLVFQVRAGSDVNFCTSKPTFPLNLIKVPIIYPSRLFDKPQYTEMVSSWEKRFKTKANAMLLW